MIINSAPWPFSDYAPVDSAVRDLAVRALELTGGRRDLMNRDDPIRHVAGHLASWFQTTIPTMLNSPDADRRAIEMQARFLCNAEGSALHAWEYAVAHRFPKLQNNGYFYRIGNDRGSSSADRADRFRGLELYAAAFSQLAAAMHIPTIPIYRKLFAQTKITAHTPIANVSWNPDHQSAPGRLWAAEADPGLVVGVTIYREMHPLVTPFNLSRGPEDPSPLRWQSM